MSHKKEEQKNKSQTGSESRQGTPEKDVKEGAKSQADKRNTRKGLDGSLKQFRRFKQKRVRKQAKRKRTLGKGALVWKKKPQRKRSVNNRSKAKEVSAVIGSSSSFGKRETSRSGPKKETAKRLVDDGKQLLAGERHDEQQGDAPEQYAVESIEGKGKKAGETILREAARAVKDQMKSGKKDAEDRSPCGERQAESRAEPTESENDGVNDGENVKPDQKPQEDVSGKGASENAPRTHEVPASQNASAQGAVYPVLPHSSGAKLQVLEDALGEDERKGISIAQNNLHTSANSDSGEEDDVLGNRYVARGDNQISAKKGEIRNEDYSLEDLGPYPEPSVTAYDFHPAQEIPPQKGNENGMGGLFKPEESKTAMGAESEKGFSSDLREPTRSQSVQAPSQKPSYSFSRETANSQREKAPSQGENLDRVQTKPTDNSVQIGGRAQLQTWQNSPMSASLNNQLPALASAQGGATVQAFANYGQAVMAQAGGGAMAGAAAGVASGGMSFAVQAGMQVGQKLIDQFKEAIQNAAASAKTSLKTWGTGTAMLMMPMILVLAIVCLFRMGGSATNVGLSENVIALMPQITEACQRHGIPEYVPLVAAVMMQESGGNVDLVNGDVMQCAEGMGYPVGTPVPVEESIDFGTALLADLLEQAGAQGPADISRISLALQSYNFGGGYLTWALEHYGGYSKENAQEFSEMQAAAMGWSGYGDPLYVDHVLRYYQVTQGGMGDRSAIANGFFAYPFPGHTWTTYAGHEGIDISFNGIEGQPVYAAAAGTVSYVQNGYGNLQGSGGLASYGNCAFINHGNGWESRYAHMTMAVVEQGQYVQEGQLLGYVGNTGNSYGAHLHLALYFNGSPSSGGVIYAEQAWPQLKE